jgi:YidC/Oxa1 family membrane protein insertase
MDKTGIIIVSICVAVLIFWVFEQQREAQQRAEQQAQFLATNTAATAQSPASPITMAAAPAAPQIFDTNIPENLVVISNAIARYTFTSRGGGLKQIDLLDYPETISARWKAITTNAAVASLNTGAPLPVLAVLGGSDLVGDGNFTVTQVGNSVRAEKLLPDGLRIIKEFRLSSNYLVDASVQLQNTTAKPLALPAQEMVIGTATPMGPDDTTFSYYGGAMWYNGLKDASFNLSYFNPGTTTLFVIPRVPKTQYFAGTNDVVWGAAYNQFFALLAMPKVPVDEFVGDPVTLPQFTSVEEMAGAPLPRGIQAAFIYPAETLTANSSLDRQITLSAGPKEFRSLADLAVQFQNHADEVMNFGSGYISFWGVGTFFAKLLLIWMNWLHDTMKIGYGWTIVVITVTLRLVFWPFTAMSVRSAKKMQALAPEIKALKEKYKDDQQKFAQKQMELWKKHRVNPMSGCFPALIQMPVFFGFLTMIRSAIELRGAHFLWVADLTKPDTLFMIPGLNFPFNLLPLLMVSVMVWQAHLTPPSPGMDPSQQKMMRWMPAIFLVFLYNYSSGMALYMTVSTLLGVVQTKVTRNLRDPAAAPVLTPRPKSKK